MGSPTEVGRGRPLETISTSRRGLLVVVGLVAVSVAWFLVFSPWWLNADGSTYLGTGRSVLDGLGFRLPDGTTVAWWNRPVYPVLVALPSLFGGGLGASIWMSRAPLILAAPLVAAGTLRLGRSVLGAALAGVVAIAQPWTLLAGGSNLVPDGLMSVAVVGAVLAASVGMTAPTSRERNRWLGAALICVVLASLTKQTGAVGLLLVGIVVWNGLARPPQWLVVTALAVGSMVTFAALVVANGAPDVGASELPRAFVDGVRAQVFPGSPAALVVAASWLLLVAWATPRATRALPLAGLTVTAAGIAVGLYASGSGLQLRNAAMLPYGAALLLGAFVGERAVSAPRWPPSRLGVAAVLVLALVAGADARAYSPSNLSRRDWDNAATRGAAEFLLAHRADRSTSCTFDYCSFLWLVSDQRLGPRLLPQFSARPTARSLAGLEFDQRTGFRSLTRSSPACTGTPLVVTKSDEGFGAIFECPLLRYLRHEHPRYLVVSGSGSDDTFDATRLIPYLSSNPAFRLVYSSPKAAWPRVVAVYQVVAEPRPVPDATSYYSAAAYAALPGDHGKPGVTAVDGDRYAAMIASDLG